MAHAIIFTDRAPVTRMFDDIKFTSAFYSYPAGAYKIASVLREMGLDVLVVPNCLSLSFAGIQQIIKQNSNNLLWVGISTTFLTINSPRVQHYRDQWIASSEPFIDTDIMFDSVPTSYSVQEMIWSTKEVGQISHWLNRSLNVPLLLGGSWVSKVTNGNLGHLHSNTYIVKGYAEEWVATFTKNRLVDSSAEVPFLVDNSNYDNNEFKNSKITWHASDFIQPSDWLPLEVARGCAFNCHYCDYTKRSKFDSYKNAETLRSELIENYEKYGVTRYLLVDDLYNDSKDKVRILYDKVWSKLPFKPEWASYMRLDMFWADPESASIIKESGAKIGSFGIETLNDRAGKRVGKGLGKRRILETLSNLKEHWGSDVLICGNFIAGLPYEPLDSIKDTLKWTSTTDLLYSYTWNPFTVDNESIIEIITDVSYLHKISQNSSKYDIKWIDRNNWINSEGVTNADVDRLVIEHMKKVPYGIKVNFTDYVDLRMAGLSHNDVVGLKTGITTKSQLVAATELIRSQIRQRLNKVINTVV